MVLRSFGVEDQETMVRLFTDDIVKKTYMVPDFESEEAAIKLFERVRELSFLTNRFVRGVYVEDTLIGIINDVGIEDGKVEVGYALDPQYHNQGYGTEMLKMAIEYLIGKGFEEVQAGAFEENVASTRIMEKAGMKRIDYTEEIEYRGKMHHCIYYSYKK